MTKLYLLICLLIIFAEIEYRLLLHNAFQYNKNRKEYCETQNHRTSVFKILGYYNIKECNAPFHMKKYYLLRLLNYIFLIIFVVLSFVVQIYYNVLICIIIVYIHFVIIELPLLLELLFLVPKHSKNPDYKLSKKP